MHVTNDSLNSDQWSGEYSDLLFMPAPQVKSIPFRCRLDLLSLGGYNNLCNSRRDNRCRDNDAKDVFDR